MKNTGFIVYDYIVTEQDKIKDDILRDILRDKLNGGTIFGYTPITADQSSLNQLYVEGFIEEPKAGNLLVLTKEGHNVASNGYIMMKMANHEKEKEIENKENLQLKQLKFTVNTRWVSLILSIIATIISIVALILNYTKK